MTPEEYRRNPTTLNRMDQTRSFPLNYVLVGKGSLVTEGIVIEVKENRRKKLSRYAGFEKKCRLPSWTASDATPGVDPWTTVGRPA